MTASVPIGPNWLERSVAFLIYFLSHFGFDHLLLGDKGPHKFPWRTAGLSRTAAIVAVTMLLSVFNLRFGEAAARR